MAFAVLDCLVCLDTFEDPRILGCGHTFCKKCLESIFAKLSGGRMACPKCRQEIPLPFEADKVLINWSVREMLEHPSAAPSAVQNNLPGNFDLVCDIHEVSAIVFCKECLSMVCSECIKEHTNHFASLGRIQDSWQFLGKIWLETRSQLEELQKKGVKTGRMWREKAEENENHCKAQISFIRAHFQGLRLELQSHEQMLLDQLAEPGSNQSMASPDRSEMIDSFESSIRSLLDSMANIPKRESIGDAWRIVQGARRGLERGTKEETEMASAFHLHDSVCLAYFESGNLDIRQAGRLVTVSAEQPFEPKNLVASPPSFDQQYKLLWEVLWGRVQPNTNHYVIPAMWLRSWREYVRGDTREPPSSIDSNPLIESTIFNYVILKPNLRPGVDYEIIPYVAWDYFVRWYGLLGPAIPRRSNSDGTISIYHWRLPLFIITYPVGSSRPSMEGACIQANGVAYSSPKATVRELIHEIARLLELGATPIRLWDFYSTYQLVLLSEESTLEDANIFDQNAILVEFQNPISKTFLVSGSSSLKGLPRN